MPKPTIYAAVFQLLRKVGGPPDSPFEPESTNFEAKCNGGALIALIFLFRNPLLGLPHIARCKSGRDSVEGTMSRMQQLIAFLTVLVALFLSFAPIVSAQEVTKIVEPSGSCMDINNEKHERAARVFPTSPSGQPEIMNWQCVQGSMQSYGPASEGSPYVKLDPTGHWLGLLSFDPTNEGWHYYEPTATPVVTNTPLPTATAQPTATATATPAATSTPQAQTGTFSCPNGDSTVPQTGQQQLYLSTYGNDFATAQREWRRDNCKHEVWTCYWQDNRSYPQQDESSFETQESFGFSKAAWQAEAEKQGCTNVQPTPKPTDAPTGSTTTFSGGNSTSGTDSGTSMSVLPTCYMNGSLSQPVQATEAEMADYLNVGQWYDAKEAGGCKRTIDLGATIGVTGSGWLSGSVVVVVIIVIVLFLFFFSRMRGVESTGFSGPKALGLLFGFCVFVAFIVFLGVNMAPVNFGTAIMFFADAGITVGLVIMFGIASTKYMKSDKVINMFDNGAFVAVVNMVILVGFFFLGFILYSHIRYLLHF